jgi:hypothetical protein
MPPVRHPRPSRISSQAIGNVIYVRRSGHEEEVKSKPSLQDDIQRVGDP